MNQDKGFFAGLFDFSFSEFITTRIIKVLYALAVIVSGFVALVMFIGGLVQFGSDPLRGFGMIILSPILFILYVIAARVSLELVIIVFRIQQNTEEIAARGRQSNTTGAQNP
ncbi:MAG: DUF4282 domain-containing protein [Armatimonadota bacterium]|nr:DUF4282 domain-containing protein [Armatimonadota bacterium]